jgi:hypothetical protein
VNGRDREDGQQVGRENYLGGLAMAFTEYLISRFLCRIDAQAKLLYCATIAAHPEGNRFRIDDGNASQARGEPACMTIRT